MVVRMLVAAAVLVISQPDLGKGSAKFVYVQSGQEFLVSEQIRMLLTGTEVSHQPQGGPGKAHLYFKSNGDVRMRAPNGKTRSGSWSIAGPGILCMKNIGGRGDKNFCVKLKRAGKEIHHYIPVTGESMNVPPWIIVKGGPNANRVPDS